jgi:hypothetical protein
MFNNKLNSAVIATLGFLMTTFNTLTLTTETVGVATP